MFWDRAAGVYDLFANVWNKKTHGALCAYVEAQISPADEVLECACGTGLLTEGIAAKCKRLVATDFSEKMLEKAEKKCGKFGNVTFKRENILQIGEPDGRFDAVVAANVIHLLDEPLRALAELDRVCRRGGKIVIPTYMNQNEKGQDSGFATVVGQAGADFKREFTLETYKSFFTQAGYADASYVMCEGRIPCAVAVLKKSGGAI